MARPTGRPRSRSDDDILDAAARVLGEVGPARLTLAAVARTVGLATSTVAERYGSKRALLLALARRGAAHAEVPFRAARGGRALATLQAAFAESAARIGDRTTLAHHTAFLTLDLGDPEFRAAAAEHLAALRAGVEALLAEAEAHGELHEGTDPATLAEAVVTAYHGALMVWALAAGDTRPLPAAVGEAVETVLFPWRVAG